MPQPSLSELREKLEEELGDAENSYSKYEKERAREGHTDSVLVCDKGVEKTQREQEVETSKMDYNIESKDDTSKTQDDDHIDKLISEAEKALLNIEMAREYPDKLLEVLQGCQIHLESALKIANNEATAQTITRVLAQVDEQISTVEFWLDRLPPCGGGTYKFQTASDNIISLASQKTSVSVDGEEIFGWTQSEEKMDLFFRKEILYSEDDEGDLIGINSQLVPDAQKWIFSFLDQLASSTDGMSQESLWQSLTKYLGCADLLGSLILLS